MEVDLGVDELIIFIIFGILGVLFADMSFGEIDLPSVLGPYYGVILVVVAFGFVVLALFTKD